MPLTRKMVVGNWKMNKTIAETQQFIEKLLMSLKDVSGIFLAVPFTALAKATEISKGTDLVIGAQNINEHPSGAYTGEISASMVKEAGAKFVLVGHSERRQFFHEGHQVIHEKIKQALNENMFPMLCVGESFEDHQAGRSKDLIEEQIVKALKGLTESRFEKVILAYEPIWAIGTGLVASVETISAMNTFCRDVVAKLFGQKASRQLRILYGGSVTADNSAELFLNDNIDGVLVGSASLTVDSFSKIVQNSRSQTAAAYHKESL